MTSQELAVRRAAFNWLQHAVEMNGDVLERAVLAEGFEWEKQRVPLLGPKGIFKPRLLSIPLSITTIPSGPYDDGYSDDGKLLYRYRGTDPNHRDNVGLREAMRQQIPLIYFLRLDKGKYLSVWPVFIVEDYPQSLTFKVAVDDAISLSKALTKEPSYTEGDDTSEEARRTYITAAVRQRVHQRSFRVRVLKAYQQQCSICRLRHTQLLDAAHIIPDSDPAGEPVVSNGLALCKLHHAAFDRQFLGVRPDYVVEVRKDILEESDGPMLQHGLKEMHGTKLWVPRGYRLQPNSDSLSIRYQEFRESCE